VWGAAAARPTITAAVIYALLATAFISPALMPGRALSAADFAWDVAPWQDVRPADVPGPTNRDLADSGGANEPFLRYTRAELHAGRIPLWNPYLMAGRPYLADAQSGVFSPFSLPAYVLPFLTSLAVIVILKLFVASLGMYLLARLLGMGFAGALLTGIVYAYAFDFVVAVQLPLSSVGALLPWVLWLTGRLVKRPSIGSGAALALAVGAQFLAGHPESSFYGLLTTGAFFLLRLFTTTSGGMRVRAVAWFGAAMLAGFMLAGAMLLPFFELLRNSPDSQLRKGNGVHIALEHLRGALVPGFWGRPTHFLYIHFPYDVAVYAGALPLMLALGALIMRVRAERLAIAAFGLLCGLVAFGAQPFFDLVTALPGFSTAYNQRLVRISLLCLALLAGWGLDDLVRTVPRRRVGMAWLGMGAILFALPLLWVHIGPWDVWRPALKVAWGFVVPPGSPFPTRKIVEVSSVIIWLTVAGAALVLLAFRLGSRLPPVLFAVLALTLVTADLFRNGVGYNPAVLRRAASLPATGAIRYLQSHRPSRFVGIGQAMQLDVGQNYRLYDARGYDFPAYDRYHRFWNNHVQAYPKLIGYGAREIPLVDINLPRRLGGVKEEWIRALSVLSVSDIMESRRDPPLQFPELRLAYDGPDARVYSNPHALPRAFLVDRQQVEPSDQAALKAVLASGFDGRRLVVTQTPIPGVPRSRVESAPSPPGSAVIKSYEGERVAVNTDSRRPAVLVLTDVHYPGWTAKVDGQDVPLHRVDYLLRGVRVPPGVHRVEFRYSPRVWKLGVALSLTALGLLVLAGAIGVRRAQSERSGAGAST
jgi:hypothetical protein